MIEGSLGSSLFCSPGYFRLQVLPDDPGDNTYGHTPLHIQTGDSKRYIVLFAGHPVVIAGVGYRIDAIGEAHIDNALVDICDTAGILALDTALLQVVPVGVLGNTLMCSRLMFTKIMPTLCRNPLHLPSPSVPAERRKKLLLLKKLSQRKSLPRLPIRWLQPILSLMRRNLLWSLTFLPWRKLPLLPPLLLLPGASPAPSAARPPSLPSAAGMMSRLPKTGMM